MATTSPVGIYYRTQGEARPTDEAMALSLANSVNNAIGLVPVIPGSVTLGSGSGSVGTTGLITFSGASSLILNNCFTSTYRLYKIVWTMSGTATNDMFAQFRGGGTTVSTNYYGGAYYTNFAGTSGAVYTRSGGSNTFFGATGSETSFGEMTVSPNTTDGTTFKPHMSFLTYSRPAGSPAWGGCGANHTVATDSLVITPGSGNISGNIQVYGYR